jgi:hypothetical protein
MLTGLLYLYFRHPERLSQEAVHYIMLLSTDTTSTFVISKGNVEHKHPQASCIPKTRCRNISSQHVTSVGQSAFHFLTQYEDFVIYAYTEID